MAALPNLVPAGIFLPAMTFTNARLDFFMSNPTSNQMFFTQNGLISNNQDPIPEKRLLE
jgi:hypothetical protein